MPQNVKIQTGFSEKTSENYNSTQHSISLEMDCVINGSTKEIEGASQKLFALCRKIVAAQKGVSVDSLLQSEPAQAGTPQNAPTPPLPSSTNSNATSTHKPATAKQIRFLLDVAKKRGLDDKTIRSLPAEYNKTSFESLSSTEASRLIDSFSPKRKAA